MLLFQPTHRRAAAALLATAILALGQSTTGSVTGLVKDSTGASIAGAAVIATEAASGFSQRTATGASGDFVFAQLPPGNYSIQIEQQGFKKIAKTGIVLNAADRLNAGDFILAVGDAVAEVITVTADAGQLQLKTESGERSDVINARQMRDLALNGRNVLDIMRIIPGVVSTVNGQVSNVQGLSDFNVNGTRGTRKR